MVNRSRKKVQPIFKNPNAPLYLINQYCKARLLFIKTILYFFFEGDEFDILKQTQVLYLQKYFNIKAFFKITKFVRCIHLNNKTIKSVLNAIVCVTAASILRKSI